jgi:hypothetical protein
MVGNHCTPRRCAGTCDAAEREIWWGAGIRTAHSRETYLNSC